MQFVSLRYSLFFYKTCTFAPWEKECDYSVTFSDTTSEVNLFYHSYYSKILSFSHTTKKKNIKYAYHCPKQQYLRDSVQCFMWISNGWPGDLDSNHIKYVLRFVFLPFPLCCFGKSLWYYLDIYLPPFLSLPLSFYYLLYSKPVLTEIENECIQI